MSSAYQADIAIVGGGVSGLWLLNLLRDAGHDAILFEALAPGAGQSLASQGMIHGGVKYTLGGAVTAASETIAAMPGRWRGCLAGELAGEGDVDLRGVNVLADGCYLFSGTSSSRGFLFGNDSLFGQRSLFGRGALFGLGASSRLATFFASKLLRGRIDRLERSAFPSALDNPAFKGGVYRLDDLVLDTASLLQHLVARQAGALFIEAVSSEQGQLVTTDGTAIQAETIILAAGAGNEALIQQAGLPVKMQRRPVHQVMVTGDLPEFHAHAVSMLSGDKPQVTITSHRHGGGLTWYLGGGLAEDGVGLSSAEQIEAARALLKELLPWIDVSACRFASLQIDRAEPHQQESSRPDMPYVKRYGNYLVCWPTKLTLAPLVGDLVLEQLGETRTRSSAAELPERNAPTPAIAQPPWLVL
ncbi:MAG: NAD(P)/FAD-dependent oxidoreductase [Pseudomonadales bacterium]